MTSCALWPMFEEYGKVMIFEENAVKCKAREIAKLEKLLRKLDSGAGEVLLVISRAPGTFRTSHYSWFFRWTMLMCPILKHLRISLLFSKVPVQVQLTEITELHVMTIRSS